MSFQSMNNFDLKGQTVLLRADLNVPKQDGKVTDTTRIDRLKPTIDYLRDVGAKVLILSHFGRPKGARDTSLSLAFLIPVLEKCWGGSVHFAQDCIGEAAAQTAAQLQNGDVALLENLRFHEGEKTNDAGFVQSLAALGDVYVNDAFSVSHRAHASTDGLARALPCAAGLLMEAELNALTQALGNPQKPVAAIVGGSKISTKLSVLYNLVEKVDVLVLGGGMANTFLYAGGGQMGASLCETDMKEEAQKIIAKAKESDCEIILPIDAVCVRNISTNAESEVSVANDIPDGVMAIDVGGKSIDTICSKLSACKTVLWNGPLGVFEIKPFDHGTNAVAQCVAEKTAAGDMVSIAGGGDTVAALENAGVAQKFSYISTAGGAFLEWMEGKTLPGVAALMDAH